MIVYSDTSWLLSYLNEDDENHAVARTAAGDVYKRQPHDPHPACGHPLPFPRARDTGRGFSPGTGLVRGGLWDLSSALHSAGIKV